MMPNQTPKGQLDLFGGPQIEVVCAKLEAGGYKPTIWQDRRIYINNHDWLALDVSRFNPAIYLDFDAPFNGPKEYRNNLWKGVSVKVWCNFQAPKEDKIAGARRVKHALLWSLFMDGIYPWRPEDDFNKVVL